MIAWYPPRSAVLCCETNEISASITWLLWGINLCPSLLCISANLSTTQLAPFLLQDGPPTITNEIFSVVLMTRSMLPEFTSVNAIVNCAFIIIVETSVGEILCTCIGIVAALPHHGRGTRWSSCIDWLSWTASHWLLLSGPGGHVPWSIGKLCR